MATDGRYAGVVRVAGGGVDVGWREESRQGGIVGAVQQSQDGLPDVDRIFAVCSVMVRRRLRGDIGRDEDEFE